MSGHRVLLAGRVSGAPAPIPGVAGSFVGAVNVISRGVKFNTWTVVLGPDLRLPRPLRHGDAVALIGSG